MIISIPIAGIRNYKVKAKKAFEGDVDLCGRLARFHHAAFP
jgi:hypothetical protein